MTIKEAKAWAAEHGIDETMVIERIRTEVKRLGSSWQSVGLFTGDTDKTIAVSYGYRKKSDDQYVPRKYVTKAWSAVYYQEAHTDIYFKV